ncbi:MAG: alpha/beta fold hydrolase [Planctomycetota bacterium]
METGLRLDNLPLVFDRLAPDASRTDAASPSVPTLFLHGLHSVRAGEKSEALFADHAARGLGALRVDLRGHGETGGSIGSTPLSRHVEDVACLLRAHGKARLFGSSFGGLIAAWTAAKHPDLVEGLTLLAPAFGFLPRLAAHRQPDGCATYPHDVGAVRFEAEVLDDFGSHHESELPSTIDCPTLVVHGADDDVVPLAEVQTFDERRPTDRRSALWILHRGDHRLADPIGSILALSAEFHRLPDRSH